MSGDRAREDATFEAAWRKALLDGFVAQTAFPAETVALLPPSPPSPSAPAPEPPPGLDLLFRPDPTLWAGASANNGWLQELPKPLTKVVWENVVAVSPALAEREKLGQGDLVRLAIGDRSVTGPAWIMPGQAADTVTLFLGYGRAVPDMLSSGLGYSAMPLRRSDAPGRGPAPP